MEKKGLFKSSIILFKSRKEVVFALSWTATFATIIAGKGIPPLTKSFLFIIAYVMINLSVYIYNDITDKEMDAYSKEEKKKGRPIAHGIVSVKNATSFVIVTGLLGLSIFFMMSRLVFAIGLTYYVILFLYSHPIVRFKKMYIVKNIVTALSMPTAILAGGVLIENSLSQSISFLAFAYFGLAFLVLPALADSLDIEEDLAFKVKTIGNTLSWKQNLILYDIGMLFILTCTLLAYRLYDIHYISPLIMAGLSISAMAHSLKFINEDVSIASVKLRPVGYAVVIFSPLIFALGAIF